MVILVLAIYLAAAIIALKVILNNIAMRKQVDAAIQISRERQRFEEAYYHYIQTHKNNDE